jgi:hypothetical protein
MVEAIPGRVVLEARSPGTDVVVIRLPNDVSAFELAIAALESVEGLAIDVSSPTIDISPDVEKNERLSKPVDVGAFESVDESVLIAAASSGPPVGEALCVEVVSAVLPPFEKGFDDVVAEFEAVVAIPEFAIYPDS